MDSFVRRCWWGVELVVIAVVAFFTVSTVNAYVEGSMRRVPEAPPIPEVKATAESSPRPPREGGGPKEPGGEKPVPGTPEAPVPSALAATLVGTVVANDPRWSLSVIIDGAMRTTGVFGHGSEVSEGYTVAKIERRRVTLRHGDRLEYLDLDGETKDSVPAPVHKNEPGSNGIQKTSPTSFVVPHSVIDNALANLNEVAGQIRLAPHLEGRRANGFKVSAVKPDGIFARLGLQNGDVLQKVNGFEINSPEKALEVLQRLKDSKSFSVKISRGGKEIHLEYAVR
jgi:general secretion pathway protein C